jgi:hypothetical protein
MQGPVLDGIGGGIIAKEPAGSYITITRYLDGALVVLGRLAGSAHHPASKS